MAAAVSSTNLTDLPEEVLYEIVSYLGYEDQVNLAATHPDLHFLRPREQRSVTMNRYYHEVPILARGLIAVKIEENWMPRGAWSFSDRPRLRLIRDPPVINHSYWPLPQGRRDWNDTNEGITETIEVSNHRVGTIAKKGDTLRIEHKRWMRSVTLVYKR